MSFDTQNSSKAWRFFEKRDLGRMVKCELCGKEIKFHSSTSAMLQHLKTSHSKELEESERAHQARQARLSETREVEKEDPNENLTLAICTSSIPFRFLKNRYFVKFCKNLNQEYKVLTPDTLRANFSKNASQYVEKMRKEIKYAEKMWMSLDGWDAKFIDEGLYAIFVYYVDSNFTIKSVLLGVQCVEGSATAQNIGKLVLEVLHKYDIDISKIIGGVTDGGTNIKSFLERNSLYHTHCAAHCISLIIKKTAAIPQIHNVIGKINRLASFLSHSKTERVKFRQRSHMLGIEGRIPLPFCETRWGGCLLLAESFQLHYQSLMATPALQKFLLSDDEKEVLATYLEIMKPFIEGLNNSESDSTFSSEILVHFSHLVDYSTNLNQRTQLARCLSSETKLRYEKYLRNEALLISTFVDPRYAYLPDVLIGRSWEFTEEVVEDYSDSIVTLRAAIDSNSNKKPVRAESSFAKFIQSKRQTVSENGLKAEMCSYRAVLVASRPSHESSPLEFWRTNKERFPLLGKVALHFLAAPQSSAMVERLFSTCGNIINSNRRNRMKATTLNDQLLNAALATLKLHKESKARGNKEDDEDDYCVDSDYEDQPILRGPRIMTTRTKLTVSSSCFFKYIMNELS